jgi:S-sulfo-L-cysteine synthase (O-acetyl-L-serine-dependent)
MSAHRSSVIDHRISDLRPPAPGLQPPTSDLRPETSILRLIGNTPLVPLLGFYAKLEMQNPGGSVKDRAAARIVTDAIASGKLKPGGTILDATSGNTGIAYAMIGASLGYRVRLCVPSNVTPERVAILRAYGAELILTDPMQGSDGAILEARRLHASDPDLFYADQYNNPSNWLAHYDTTAYEIWQQTDGRITHLVCGLGTSGTLMGAARRLRELNPRLHVTSIQPEGPLHGIEGLKHMPSAIVPGIYDPDVANEDATVSTEDAHEMTRRLAREHGLLAGVSSGAAAVIAGRLATREPDAVVVTIFPDGGARYLSEPFWSEAA